MRISQIFCLLNLGAMFTAINSLQTGTTVPSLRREWPSSSSSAGLSFLDTGSQIGQSRYRGHHMISSGFSFSDGEQILVSVQKPLGIVLEQDPENGIISVTEVDPNGSAGKGGVMVGDFLIAVQNTSIEGVDLEEVLAYIGNGPRVMNFRFSREA